MSLSRTLPIAGLFGLLALSACGGGTADNPNIRPVADNEYNDYRTKGGERGKLGGESGLVFGIGKGTGSAANLDGAALGVNAYLWRGALYTLAFMPLGKWFELAHMVTNHSNDVSAEQAQAQLGLGSYGTV